MMRFWVTSIKVYEHDASAFEFGELRFDGMYGFGTERPHSYEGPLTYLKDGVRQQDFGQAGRGHRRLSGSFNLLWPQDPGKVPEPPFLLAGTDHIHAGFAGLVVVDAIGPAADVALSHEPGGQLPFGGADWFGVATFISHEGTKAQFALRTYYTTVHPAGPQVGEMVEALEYGESIGPIVSLREGFPD
ncbi:hypothetical protein DES53_108311 [Roseimicrobium gellanilyticum]|uniref:Uncharacterized protein n=1 Tax=Roseimicrobium gellanilyticum TaxID=748857 RepID=A0A366HFZ7_9BACT|nr:hypothetical protein [Roseimicrobium gellanilyticum]RBP40604.1 hypothetical protein DES53_108311 [Roseimicrobium gellanilyticum]